MNIGFLENHLSIRGTSVSLYEYAHYNETILKNNSFIITRKKGACYDIDETDEVHYKFSKRFGKNFIYYNDVNDIQTIIDNNNIKILYIIKGGNIDNLSSFKNCKTIIHCVFNTKQKHGDFYCCISPWLNKYSNTNIPVLPHMISLTPVHIKDFVNENLDNINLKKELNIPENMYVIGRYGGLKQFDIPFVKNVVRELSYQNNNLFFLFMNTEKFDCNPKKSLFLDSNTKLDYKFKFINSCNALLHARSDGETFGLTVGEFAVNKKQIITYDTDNIGYAKNHIDFLGNQCHLFKNEDELKKILNNIESNEINMENNKYMLYTPDKVMSIFKIIFNKLMS